VAIGPKVKYFFPNMISRSPNPILSIDVGERVYVADVDYPMAVVGTAGRGLIIYNLENQPKEYKRVEPPLKYQHRCISIFKDKKASPVGKIFFAFDVETF
jgi:mRNA export factor